MNPFFQLLIRHLLASAGGFFAAHQITGSSTSSIVVGLLTLAIPTLWSWIAKVLDFDEYKGKELINGSEAFRILLASLVSQGITALSVYFAVDANHPEILLGALVNAGAAKFGLHQKAVGMPAVKLMIASLCLLSLSSCANDPGSREALIKFGKRVALSVAETAVVVAQMELATRTQDWINAKTAGDHVKEMLAQTAMLSAQQSLTAAAKALAKEKAKLDKQPVNVSPKNNTASSVQGRELSRDLSSGFNSPRVGIPLYGNRVAFMLGTADVRN